MSNLASADFMLVVRLIEKFVSDCASITGREHPNLRAPLLSQVKQKFLTDARIHLYLIGKKVPGEFP